MANQAYVDPDTTQVIGWYFHDAFTYDTLPPAEHLVDMTQEQWDARHDAPFWLYQDGTFIPVEDADLIPVKPAVKVPDADPAA